MNNNENKDINLPDMNKENVNPVPMPNVNAMPQQKQEQPRILNVGDDHPQQMVDDVKKMASREAHNFMTFMKDIFKYLTTRNSSDLFELLWRVAIIALFIIILGVPFNLIKESGTSIFMMFGIDFNKQQLDIWNSIWTTLYCVLGVVLFYVICKARYYELIKHQQETKKIIQNIENKVN